MTTGGSMSEAGFWARKLHKAKKMAHKGVKAVQRWGKTSHQVTPLATPSVCAPDTQVLTVHSDVSSTGGFWGQQVTEEETTEGMVHLGSLVGEGSRGSVFKCLWRNQNMWHERATKAVDFKARSYHRDEFYTERDMLRRLQGCPNVIQLDFDMLTLDGDVGLLVMPFGYHGTLVDRVLTGGYSVADALRWTAKILTGLEHAHKRGVMHRDMKSGNLVLAENRHDVQIIDWVGGCLFDDMHERKTYCGTNAYLAPEMALRGAYDHKIDIWGVGLIALELLTGQVANMHKDLDSVRINRHTLFDRVHYLARRVYKNELDLATYYKTLDALLTVNTRHNMPSWMLHGPLACPHIFDKIKVLVRLCLTPISSRRMEARPLRSFAERILSDMEHWTEAHGLDLDEISVPLQDTLTESEVHTVTDIEAENRGTRQSKAASHGPKAKQATETSSNSWHIAARADSVSSGSTCTSYHTVKSSQSETKALSGDKEGEDMAPAAVACGATSMSGSETSTGEESVDSPVSWGSGMLEGPLMAIRLSDSLCTLSLTSEPQSPGVCPTKRVAVIGPSGSDTCTSEPQSSAVCPTKLPEAVVLIDLATTETTTNTQHKTGGVRGDSGDKKGKGKGRSGFWRSLIACFTGAKQ